MRRKTISSMLGGVVIGILGTTALTSYVSARTAEKNSSRIILENDLVRVKEAIFMPGDKHPGMHAHEYAHVGVPLDDGKLTFHYPDGKSETMEVKSGKAGFREANVTHEAINMGDKPLRVIEVEIKRPG